MDGRLERQSSGPQMAGNPAYTELMQGHTRMEYSNPVLSTVMRRKQTEKEVEALENRIKRLELEEAKAKKGVQLARERNQHLVQAHERNKKTAIERREHDRARRAAVEARREAVLRQKAEQREKLQRAFVGMYNEKLGEARQVREEQQQVLQEAAKVRERDRTRNAGRHEAIRNRRKELSERFEQQRIAHQVCAVSPLAVAARSARQRPTHHTADPRPSRLPCPPRRALTALRPLRRTAVRRSI